MGTVQIESNVLHYWRKEINTSKIKHYTLKTKVFIWKNFFVWIRVWDFGLWLHLDALLTLNKSLFYSLPYRAMH